MFEADELKRAKELARCGQKKEALPILVRLLNSKHMPTKLDAALALLVTLDLVTQNEALLEVVDEALGTASSLGRSDVHVYLLSQKARFLSTKLSQLTYRQKILMLTSQVFHWIAFSLSEDEKEFKETVETRIALKKEIEALTEQALTAVQQSENHYMNGHLLSALGEVTSARVLSDKLELYDGGKWMARVVSNHYVRRWNLDVFFGCSREQRHQLMRMQKQSDDYCKRAISEFEKGGHESDLARALYGLAAQYALTYRFRKANKYLGLARRLALRINETELIAPIEDLEKIIKDRYRHRTNWVREMGLDLPRGVQRRKA